MGILDQVLGGVLGQALGGGRGGTQGALIQAVLGMLLQGGTGGRPMGSSGGGLSDVVGGLVRGGGQPGGGGQLGGMLNGGLGGLAEIFGQAGMRQQVDSWIAQGPNMAVSPQEIAGALGKERLGELAAQAGMSHEEAAGQLSEILPSLVDRMTPGGAMPREDLGADEFGTMMSDMLNPRR